MSTPSEKPGDALAAPLLTDTDVTDPTQQPVELLEETEEQDVPQSATFEKGELQSPGYRDIVYAVLFFVQFVGVLVVAVLVGFPNMNKANIDMTTNDNSSASPTPVTVAALMVVTCLTALLLSGASLYFMYKYSLSAIKIGFLVSPVLFIMFGLVCLASNDEVDNWFGVLWFVCAFSTVCFACVYWRYVPFAAANLKTGLAAIHAHSRVVWVAFGLVIFGSIFSMMWWTALLGVLYRAPNSCYDSGGGADDDMASDVDCRNDLSGLYVILLLFCYYWTHYALEGVNRVTVAGAVGTWWFQPEAEVLSEESVNAVQDSLTRSLTYSFGSICLGSLIVAVLQTMKQLVAQLRRRDVGAAGSILLCLLECILMCLRNLVEYINDWAYVYIGLYGYGFVDAAKNVFELFRTHGWSTILSNSLVVRTLILFMLMVGSLTGLVTVLVGYLFYNTFLSALYGAGVTLGILFASIVLTVVDGAVKTSIVCFAEARPAFATNHPDLHNEMIEAFASMYPTIFVAATPVVTIVDNPTTTQV